MRIFPSCALILLLFSKTSTAQNALFPNNGSLFDDKLHSINIIIPERDFEALQHPDSLWNNRLYPITFVYDGVDTVKKATIRLKGNTSRGTAKKSFRIDFDKLVNDQTYQGLETINIHGNHNDASMMREYLSAYVMRELNIPCNRVNHIKLYINGTYYGLRSLVEYIDKDFLKTRFGSNKGNSYKCTWPADLTWLGTSQQKYKDVINPSPLQERAYELKTNEELDDYTRFVTLIDIINNRKNQVSFPQDIEAIFNVNGYLKALAAEVLIGHWDNYFYNKNNYFVYDHPTTKKFVYLPYDMDNTFGVQWGVSNINKRDIHQWGNSNVKAPLTESLLAHDAYRKQYEFYLFEAVQDVFNESHLFPIIDSLYRRIESAIATDPQYLGQQNSTYGYRFADWKKSVTQSLGDHNTHGIKPYISDRVKSAKEQFRFSHDLNHIQTATLRIFPNPGTEGIQVLFDSNQPEIIQLLNVHGSVLKSHFLISGEEVNTSDLTPGCYYIRVGQIAPIKWLKID